MWQWLQHFECRVSSRLLPAHQRTCEHEHTNGRAPRSTESRQTFRQFHRSARRSKIKDLERVPSTDFISHCHHKVGA